MVVRGSVPMAGGGGVEIPSTTVAAGRAIDLDAGPGPRRPVPDFPPLPLPRPNHPAATDTQHPWEPGKGDPQESGDGSVPPNIYSCKIYILF